MLSRFNKKLLILSLCSAWAFGKTILVTGGAGYIGSATVLRCLQNGYQIIVIDKKFPESRYFEDARKITPEEISATVQFPALAKYIMNNVIFVKSDYADPQTIDRICSTFKIDALIHFAGFLEVGRSVKDPLDFYRNNVSKTVQLIDSVLKHNVKKVVFSSSAAVYGIPETDTIQEAAPCKPINPYGNTKLAIELFLEDLAKAGKLQAIALRYFNAAGALVNYDIGERHDPETHVIPILLQAAYQKKSFSIFGTDYPTADGSCERDYLHISDIAEAHVKALEYLETNSVIFEPFNLGTGIPVSVKELVKVAESITGSPIKTIEAARRPGDPARLIANPSKATIVLGWKPSRSSIKTIIETAHRFHNILDFKLAIDQSKKKGIDLCNQANQQNG